MIPLVCNKVNNDSLSSIEILIGIRTNQSENPNRNLNKSIRISIGTRTTNHSLGHGMVCTRSERVKSDGVMARFIHGLKE